jgi:hypothetical protein
MRVRMQSLDRDRTREADVTELTTEVGRPTAA